MSKLVILSDKFKEKMQNKITSTVRVTETIHGAEREYDISKFIDWVDSAAKLVTAMDIDILHERWKSKLFEDETLGEYILKQLEDE